MSNTISSQNRCRPLVYQHTHHLSYQLGREKLVMWWRTLETKSGMDSLLHWSRTGCASSCQDEIRGWPDCVLAYHRLSLEPAPLSHHPFLIPLTFLTLNYVLGHDLNMGDSSGHSKDPAIFSQTGRKRANIVLSHRKAYLAVSLYSLDHK